MAAGHWHTDPHGGQTYIVNEDVTYEQLLAGLLEQRRRGLATDARFEAIDHLADHLAAELGRRMPDVDPEVVCRVGLLLVSTAGALLAAGMAPTAFMNVACISVAKHAGHIAPPP